MALLISPDNIPTVGDFITNIELSKDKEVIWITFNSGAVTISYVSPPDGAEVEGHCGYCYDGEPSSPIEGDVGSFRCGSTEKNLNSKPYWDENAAEIVHPKVSNYDEDGYFNSPIFCEHANEMPLVCPCPDNCYCKKHSCREEK